MNPSAERTECILSDADHEAIAVRVVELLLRRPPAAGELVDARTLAPLLGVSVEFVRDHADELGAVRLGDGPRPRLRFDVEAARSALTARHAGRRSEAPDLPLPSAKRRRRPEATVELLPIRRPNGARRGAEEAA